jgi:hypothetical protein
VNDLGLPVQMGILLSYGRLGQPLRALGVRTLRTEQAPCLPQAWDFGLTRSTPPVVPAGGG